MSKLLEQINNTRFENTTVDELVNSGILFEPLDGNHGGTHPKNKDYVVSGVPFVMASDITDSGELDLTTCKFISEQQARSLRKGFAKNGDILLSHKATIGRVAEVVTNKEFIMLTPQVTYYRIKDKNKLLPSYLKYYFKSRFFQNTIKVFASSGSTRDYIGIQRQHGLPIKIPNIPIQKKIALILGAYDEKIENNNKLIKNLETTAQTIFNEWFVNFNFPEHEKVKMVESELGEIPERWIVGKISDFGNVVCGKTPSKSRPEYFNGEFPFIKIPDMHGQMFILHTEDSLTRAGIDTQKNKLVPEGSICVSCIATVGLVSITTEDSQTNQQINTVVPNDKYFIEYLYFVLTNLKNDLLAIGSGGSATLNVNTSVFSDLEVLIPKSDIIKNFHLRVSPFFNQTKQLLKENISLKESRDQLLAKLI